MKDLSIAVERTAIEKCSAACAAGNQCSKIPSKIVVNIDNLNIFPRERDSRFIRIIPLKDSDKKTLGLCDLCERLK